MIRLLRTFGVMLAGLCALLGSSARAAESPITLNEVLQSSADHAPAILEAITRERQAQGRELSAQGAFDLLFEGDAQSRLLGTYSGSIAEAKATRPLTTNGGSLYTGYRVSSGDFPIYEDKSYTDRFGEVKVGAVFSLLRDRAIDERRTKLGLAESDRELARLDRQFVAIGVQRRAIDAYQQWVAAGLRLSVYRELLSYANERQASIERQVQLGARPAILATENRQNMVRRQVLVVRAEQDLATAANALSFYYRSSDGERLVPQPDRLPNKFPVLRIPLVGPDLVQRISRPDLGGLNVRLAQTDAKIDLARNELLPRLDVRAEASKDLGPPGPGGRSRDPAEAIVGLRFSLPLERRAARGKIAEAEAEADGIRMRRKLIEDQIGVELRGLAIQVDAADRLTALAGDESHLAERMAAAERRRFSLGASDFLVVNLREESAADARLRQLDAEFRRSAARAELVAVSADREQLGL